MKHCLTKVLLFCVLIIVCNKGFAQVTIGSNEAPVPGALLDMNMGANGLSTKGLSLPRVELKNIKTEVDLAKTMGRTVNLLNAGEHIGLVVYNTGKDESSLATRFCPGVHVWDGTLWQPVIPYSVPSETRNLKSSFSNGLTHLTPSDAMWATLGKNPSQYPLGYLGTFTDNRTSDTQQIYPYTRFYVGYTSDSLIYEVTTDISCAQDLSKTIVTKDTVVSGAVFEDGVWMTENLRATRMPDGTYISRSNTATSNTVPYYGNPNASTSVDPKLGFLYNWAAAINMGEGSGQTSNPGNVDQGALNNSPFVQGICPSGWHLPTDRQWTDLENGIILNTTKFSSLTTDIGMEHYIDYDALNWQGETVGNAMKNSITLSTGFNVKGASNPTASGGFYAYIPGYIDTGGAKGYGLYTYFWSSSSATTTGSLAWSRYLVYNDARISRGTNASRTYLLSVRCMRDQ